MEIELWSVFCESDASLSHPCFSFAFAHTMHRVRPPVFVAVLEKFGRTLGFLPFQFPSPAARVVRWGERVGGILGDRFGVIAAESLGLSSAQLLHLAGLNSLVYSFLPEEQLRHGFAPQRAVIGQRLRLGDDPALFWSGLKASSHKFTQGLERKERVLTRELGPLRMTFQAGASELPRLVAVKREQYRRTGARDILADRWRVGAFEELLCTADGHCTGVLSTLFAGDTWLASHLGIMSRSVFHHWFPVYNTDWAKCSPGHIMTKELIGAAIKAGVLVFDFAAYGDYKDFFRPEPYTFHSGFWRADGFGGLLNNIAVSLSWRFARLKRSHRARRAALRLKVG